MADLREALEAAFDSDTSTDTEIPASSTPTEPTPSGDGSSTETTAPTTPEPSEGDGRARDGLGRFLKATQVDGKGQEPPAPGAQPTGAPAQPQGQPPQQNTPRFEPPPRGVPPALRSHWTGLTPEWRQHIAETHTKVQQIEEQYRPAVDFATKFMQTVQPYQQAIQAETGGDPIAAVRGLMDTAARLRFGTPGEKAATVAQIVKSYGVDIEALDGALAGVVPPAGQPQQIDVQGAVQQALAPLFQQAQARRAAQEQQAAQTIKTELDAFAADPKNEFFEDVRDLMADAIEVAARQGFDLPLNDAYHRACLLHPEVSKVMLARQQGQTAQTMTQAAQRARAAAVSVKGSAPVGSPEPTAPTSVRDAIEAAIEAHSRV
jgi:hypothetical protein